MRESTGIAVLPISNGVMERRIEPDIVEGIARNVTVGIHGLSFPTPSRDLIFKMITCVGFNLSDVIGRCPFELEGTIRIPFTEARMAARNEDGGFRAIDWGDDLESKLAHAGNTKLAIQSRQSRE
jgi:hypothetical protein